MKRFGRLTLACFLSISLSITGQVVHDSRPTLSTKPLNADQIAIYRDLLLNYDNGSGTRLNIAQTTVPFELHEQETCLQQVALADVKMMKVHDLSKADHLDDRAIFVDPKHHQQADPGKSIHEGKPLGEALGAGFAGGLFSLSEIVFSKDGRTAALSYSFVCGALCGNGGTRIYEKAADGRWVPSNVRCGFWMS